VHQVSHAAHATSASYMHTSCLHPTLPPITMPHAVCTTQHNTLQHTATHCNTLQNAAEYCNTLQHTATHRNTLQGRLMQCVDAIRQCLYATRPCLHATTPHNTTHRNLPLSPLQFLPLHPRGGRSNTPSYHPSLHLLCHALCSDVRQQSHALFHDFYHPLLHLLCPVTTGADGMASRPHSPTSRHGTQTLSLIHTCTTCPSPPPSLSLSVSLLLSLSLSHSLSLTHTHKHIHTHMTGADGMSGRAGAGGMSDRHSRWYDSTISDRDSRWYVR